MRLTGLTGAEAGAPPSSPAKLRIAALHPNDKKNSDGDDGGGRRHHQCDNGCGGQRRRVQWPLPEPRLKVVLPSPTLLPSRNDGGLRGAHKPVAYCASAFANAAAPARCMAAGMEASCREKKTKA